MISEQPLFNSSGDDSDFNDEIDQLDESNDTHYNHHINNNALSSNNAIANYENVNDNNAQNHINKNNNSNLNKNVNSIGFRTGPIPNWKQHYQRQIREKRKSIPTDKGHKNGILIRNKSEKRLSASDSHKMKAKRKRKTNLDESPDDESTDDFVVRARKSKRDSDSEHEVDVPSTSYGKNGQSFDYLKKIGRVSKSSSTVNLYQPSSLLNGNDKSNNNTSDGYPDFRKVTGQKTTRESLFKVSKDVPTKVPQTTSKDHTFETLASMRSTSQDVQSSSKNKVKNNNRKSIVIPNSDRLAIELFDINRSSGSIINDKKSPQKSKSVSNLQSQSTYDINNINDNNIFNNNKTLAIDMFVSQKTSPKNGNVSPYKGKTADDVYNSSIAQNGSFVNSKSPNKKKPADNSLIGKNKISVKQIPNQDYRNVPSEELGSNSSFIQDNIIYNQERSFNKDNTTNKLDYSIIKEATPTDKDKEALPMNKRDTSFKNNNTSFNNNKDVSFNKSEVIDLSSDTDSDEELEKEKEKRKKKEKSLSNEAEKEVESENLMEKEFKGKRKKESEEKKKEMERKRVIYNKKESREDQSMENKEKEVEREEHNKKTKVSLPKSSVRRKIPSPIDKDSDEESDEEEIISPNKYSTINKNRRIESPSESPRLASPSTDSSRSENSKFNKLLKHQKDSSNVPIVEINHQDDSYQSNYEDSFIEKATSEVVNDLLNDFSSDNEAQSTSNSTVGSPLLKYEEESKIDIQHNFPIPSKKAASVEQVIKPVFRNLPNDVIEEYKTFKETPLTRNEITDEESKEGWKLDRQPDDFIGLRLIGSMRRHPRSGEVLNSKVLTHTFLAHIDQAEALCENRNTFTIRNDVDDEPCPPVEFIYSNKPYYCSGVPKNSDKFIRRCNCTGRCDPETCECAQRQKYIFEGFCDRNCAYDEKGLLMTRDLPIFECNDQCGCDDTCPNKVTSKPTKFALEIFKRKLMGWGVRTRKKIKKGQFLGIYSGEYITNDEAIRRSDVYDKVNRKYDFDIDFYHLRNKKMYAKATSCVKKTFEKLPDEGYIGNDDEEQHIDSSAPMQSLISPKKELQQQRHIDFDLQSYFTIDAFFWGNFTRFINHCCSPNLLVQPVYTNQTSVDLPYLGFYALKDIRENEELSISYMGIDSEEEDVDQLFRKKRKSKKKQKANIEQAEGARCYCSAPNCRGKLFNTTDNYID